RPRITYQESVLEALCVGWIDSLAGTLDDERSMLWFGPRKANSGWSRPNKQRIEELERQGRMLPAGIRSIEVAKANGAWTSLDDVENLVVPADLVAALSEQDAWKHWDEFPRSSKRAILVWIMQAKTASTRAKRIGDTAEKAGRGERAR
ncbi:MAG: YdeI/OmpD-associated family protein, partial [Nakamurella sp.]